MNRISKQFDQLRASGRKGFIPFVTAGDPDLATSLSIVETLANEGADVIELGVPFSDPMADGPTIQASSQRALANGVRLSDVLELAREFRSRYETPLALFGYLNPFIQYGIDRFRDDAARAGIDGVLVTDIVDDEAVEMSDLLAEKDIDLISLVAPTTTDERLAKIAGRARGFIYAVSRAGVTGARHEISSAAEDLVNRVRKFTDLPVAVGFGISTREQIESTWKYADATVVGSAIVNEIGLVADGHDVVERVRTFVRGLLPQVAKSPTGI
jgi:tryptophan synthase alpha chain